MNLPWSNLPTKFTHLITKYLNKLNFDLLIIYPLIDRMELELVQPIPLVISPSVFLVGKSKVFSTHNPLWFSNELLIMNFGQWIFHHNTFWSIRQEMLTMLCYIQKQRHTIPSKLYEFSFKTFMAPAARYKRNLYRNSNRKREINHDFEWNI